jgi:hypothetical protein
MWPRRAAGPSTGGPAALDVERIRTHFDFPATGRVVTNNAASTQPPRELLALNHCAPMRTRRAYSLGMKALAARRAPRFRPFLPARAMAAGSDGVPESARSGRAWR